MRLPRLHFGMMMMFAVMCQHAQTNIPIDNRNSPGLKISYSGGYSRERCQKYYSNKRKRNIIRKKMARKSRQINRRINK